VAISLSGFHDIEPLIFFRRISIESESAAELEECKTLLHHYLSEIGDLWIQDSDQIIARQDNTRIRNPGANGKHRMFQDASIGDGAEGRGKTKRGDCSWFVTSHRADLFGSGSRDTGDAQISTQSLPLDSRSGGHEDQDVPIPLCPKKQGADNLSRLKPSFSGCDL
jgi:hypothetical protein